MEVCFLSRPEGTLAYSDGESGGEPVLMLPGMGALRSEYRYLATALAAAGYRPISVDLRGHGESSVPWDDYDVPAVGGDILALIDHLAAGPAHVIGTSFAAGAAVWAAAEAPERVRSLVLIGAFVRTVRVSPIMGALFWLMMHNPWRVPLWAAYYRSLYPTRPPVDLGDYLAQLKANLSEPGRMQAASALANSSRQPSAERLSRVAVPTLTIMGTRDPDFPDPAAEGAWIAQQTGGRVELIEGAGHYPQTEMPEQVSPLIVEFLRQTA